MREFSLPAIREVSPEENLTDAMWRNAVEHPDEVSVQRLLAGEIENISAAEVRDAVIAVAKGLIASGIAPGDRVAIMSPTRYEWTLLDYAIWVVGAVTVPIYPTAAANQVQWILRDSGAVACVVADSDQHAMIGALPGLDAPPRIWQLDPDDSDGAAGDDQTGAIAELRRAGADVNPAEVEARRTAVGAEDLATIIYTSGTTGRPKGCRLLHRNFLFGVGNGMVVCENLFHPRASTLLFLPLAHVLAREIQCGAFITRTVVSHSPDRKHLLEDLARISPTALLAIPLVMERVYNGARQKALLAGKERIFDAAAATAIAYSKALDDGGPGLKLRIKRAVFDRLLYRKIRAAFGGRCTGAITGGSALGERLGHFYRGIGASVYEGYGLTETTAACTVNHPAAYKIGTVGQPLPGVTIGIADDGEVLVKSELVFDGYWNDPVGTAQVLDDDGWFRTGDLGRLDDEGFLSITGRKKEIIVTSGGKNVAPGPMEDGLRAHPLISQCLVIGDDKPFVSCLITIDPDMFEAWKQLNDKPSNATVAQLSDDPVLRGSLQEAVDSVNATVSRAESIKVFRVLPRDFTIEGGELTPSLKVKRHAITELYLAEIAEIYG